MQINTPEQGQIVTVRQRRYVVVDVQKSSISSSMLALGAQEGHHLVTLSSIEDDGMGETLRVVWEVEPGTSIEEKVGLPQPTGFDRPDVQDAFLNAVRWGAVSSADMRALQAPFRSGIEIEDYQLDPLVRAIQMPRANLLIADDVGLGKTVETGLVIQELIVRNRARTAMIICPAGLQTHWRDQMRDKFGLEFRIVDSLLMKQLRRSRGIHTNPWTHFPRLITSIDFIKRDTPLRLFREVLPKETTYPRRFDILVVDEAHNVSPSGSTHYAIDSQRTQAVREIAPHFEHKLFLSATPHNGYPESFSALLELLDNQRFARGVPPERKQLESVMVRRLKSEIKDAWGERRFPKRILDVIEVPYTDEEKQVHRWLKEYSQSRQHALRAKDQEERFAVEFVLKLLKKRLFSSPAAFAMTLAKHMETVKGGKRPPQPKQMTLGVLRRQLAQIDEDYADDDQYEEDTTEAVKAASPLIHDVTAQEQNLLDKMYAWAEQAAMTRDSKAVAFVDWLKGIVKPGGVWSDERVILFTEYRATQNWLQTLLAAEGLTEGERMMTLFGGMDDEKRENVKAAFQASPDQSAVRILLATDAASEGIDLQNYCHRLVHFEIPWNPNRMEQRNGRVDRHGQKHDVLIYHFVVKGYKKQAADLAVDELDADLEFLARAAEKVENIREDLGKVGMVIAAQVEEAMLGKRRRLDTQLAEDDARALRKLLKFERDLKKQVEQYADQLKETRLALKLAPESIEHAVRVALEVAGQPPLTPTPGPSPKSGREESAPSRFGGGERAFFLPALRGSWAECSIGLEHPHTREVRPIVFDHDQAKGRDDVVLAHLNHRLVQMSLRLLRSEVWSPQGKLKRVTARIAPNHALTTPVVVAHARLVLVGGEGARLHEEIIMAGGEIDQGRFRRMNVTQVNAALDAGTGKPVSPKTEGNLQSVWQNVEGPLVQSLEARMKDRLDGMQKLLVERKEKEIADVRAILGELDAMIRRELDDPSYKQLELFSASESDQYKRNVQALRLRLEQIPGELAQEIAAIEERYADPQPRLFPVAVTFLVPEKYA